MSNLDTFRYHKKRVTIMPGLRKCVICGNEFKSIHGKTACCEQCFIQRRKLQNQEGNRRRYAKESNIPYDKVCPVCGKVFESVKRKYCSEQCSQKARQEQVRENSKQYYEQHRDFIIEKNKIRNAQIRKNRKNRKYSAMLDQSEKEA